MEDLKKKYVGEPIKRMDAALFDSGEHADKARKERQDKNAKDQGSKSELNKAGNAAMSKYKRENASEFATMTEDQQKSALSKAREDGMAAKAKKLGISDEDLKRLKSDKGLKYEGSNLFIAGMQAAKQKTGFGGGTLSSSLNDEKDKRVGKNMTMTYGEAKESMKKMTSEEKDKFVQASKDGKVAIGKSTSQQIAGYVGTTTKVAASPLLLTGAGLVGVGDVASAAANVVSGGRIGSTSFAMSKAIGADKAAKKTFGSLKDAAKAIGRKVENARGAGEWKEAITQLEDSKQITRMAAGKFMGVNVGTNFARPDEEKKKIQAQVEKNRAEKKVKAPTKTDATTIAKLESEAKGQDKDEQTKRPVLSAVASTIFGSGALSNASQVASAPVKSGYQIGAGLFTGTKELFKGNFSEAGSAVSKSFSAAAEPVSGGADYLSKTSATAKNKEGNISQTAAKVKEELAATKAEISGSEAKRDLARQAITDIGDVENLKKQAAIASTPEARAEFEKQIEDVKRGSQYFQDAEAVKEQREIQQDPKASKEAKAVANAKIKQISSKSDYIESAGAGGKQNALGIINKAGSSIKNTNKRLKKLEAMDKAMTRSGAVKAGISLLKNPKADDESYKKLSRLSKITGGRFATEEDKKSDYKKTIADHKEAKSQEREIRAAQKDYLALEKEGAGKYAASAHEEFAQKYGHLNKPEEEI
jgi:hypothetical protein